MGARPCAADGYGRMARKPALTLLHLGPGLANALANLHNARRAGTPLINIIGTAEYSTCLVIYGIGLIENIIPVTSSMFIGVDE